MNRIEEALQRLFQKYRVVFWYDEKKELTQQFQAISLPGVEKVKVENNQFEVKHEILLIQLRFHAPEVLLIQLWF